MEITLTAASREEESVLRNLMELYLYDFGEFDGADVDAQGLYGYDYLDRYWTEPGRYPFLVRADGKLAGFVLVRAMDESDIPGTHSIAEFLVMRKYRRQGVGRAAAQRVFDLFPGPWSVAQIPNNLPAQAFWRRVIGEYTGGDYQETWHDDEAWRGRCRRSCREQAGDPGNASGRRAG